MIISNMIKCNVCGSIIQSKYRHDFVYCFCRKVAVDGGTDYLKRVGNEEDYTEMSIERNDWWNLHYE